MRNEIIALALGCVACASGCFHVIKIYDADSSARRLGEIGESPVRRRSGRTMYRAFVHSDRTYVIRFEREYGQVIVRAVTTDGDLLYDSSVPEEVWQQLTNRVIASGFWGLPREGTPRSEGFVLHGEGCDVEGMLSGNYHVVERGILDTTPRFSEVCEYFFTSISLPSPFSEYFMHATDPPHGKTAWELDHEQQ